MRHLIFSMVAVLLCSAAQADIIGLVLGNDKEALLWLEAEEGVTDLDFIVKQEKNDGNVVSKGPGGKDFTLDKDWSTEFRSGAWELANPTFEPEYWFVKFDGMVAIYDFMDRSIGQPWEDEFDLDSEVYSTEYEIDLDQIVRESDGSFSVETIREVGDVETGGQGSPNPTAAVSHISVYGMVPEPASLASFGLGLVCLAGIGRRQRRRRKA